MEFPRQLGSYTLLSQLGEGGMGRVYLAVSGAPGLETLSVIKTILPELKAHPAAVSRFRHEADVVRRLVHGNLVSTHAIGEADGEVFLVQDFVEGHDLGSFLDKVVLESEKPERELACYFIREVARALAYAHSFEGLHLIHCDLSPSNIRLTYAGEVKLMDFGVAASRLLSTEDPASNIRFGKVAYMAPEQIECKELSSAVDVYALGVLLWEMLTAQPLGTEMKTRGLVLPGDDPLSDALQARLASRFARPSTFDADIPSDLDELVLAMLNRDPAKRPTADSVRVALSAFIPAKYNPEGVLAAAMNRYFRRTLEKEARDALVAQSRHRAVQAKQIAADAEERAGASATLPMQQPGPSAPSRWKVGAMALAIGLGLAAFAVTRFDFKGGSNSVPAPLGQTPPIAVPVSPSTVVPSSPKMEESPAAAVAPSLSQPVPVAVSKRRTATKPIQSRPAARPSKEPPSDVVSAEAAMMAAKDAFAKGDLAAAKAEARRAIDAGAGAPAYSLLGNVFFKLSRWQDSVAAFEKARDLAPSDALIAQRLRLARAKVEAVPSASAP